MRKILVALFLLFANVGHAQQSGFYPWTFSYPNIGYDFGGVTFPSTVPGGAKGVGSVNLQALYINGQLTLGGSLGAGIPVPTISSRGGVLASACATSSWFDAVSTIDGSFSCSQPSFADILGQVSAAQVAAGVAVANLGFTPLNPANNLSDLGSAQTARGCAGLNLECLTAIADADYSASATDRFIYYSTLTAARTVTLPAANSVNAGTMLRIVDLFGLATGSNTISVALAGSDTINGGTSPVIAAAVAYGGLTFVSDGASKWNYTAPGSGTVTSVGSSGALYGGPITGSGTLGAQSLPPQVRITLTSGTPVLTSNVSGATTVFCTPYEGNLIPVWDGTRFAVRTFTELSQALSDTTKSPAAAAANSNYDYFVWDDSGTLRCTRGPSWAAGAVAGSDTARGTGAGSTELQRTNGFLNNKNAITNGPGAGAGLYVGTIRTNGSSTVDWTLGSSAAGGGAASLGVWNQFNRVEVLTQVQDSNASWGYATASWRSADNSTSNRISAVFGGGDEALEASYLCVMQQSGATVTNSYIGIGIDSTSAPSGGSGMHASGGVASGSTPTARTIGNLVGWHFFQALELGASGVFFGAPGVHGLTLRARM